MAQKRRKPVATYETFYIQLADWEPGYSFALRDPKRHEGTYWEHVELTVRGFFLSPQRVKGRCVRAVFLGSRDEQQSLEKALNSDWTPRNIGVLTLRGDSANYLGSLPNDAVWNLVQAFSSGLFGIIQLHGLRERGRIEVRSVHFSRDVDPEDL